MSTIEKNARKNNFLYAIAGLGGISLIVLIHEIGHFLFAKFFNVPTPIFSVGFGPALFSIKIGQTMFNVALLPFGGYVEMDQAVLAQLPYIPKMLIIFAGILFNLIFAYLILFYYAIRKKSNLKQIIINSIRPPDQEESEPNNGIIGPVGIVSILSNILIIQPQAYWLLLAILSLNMGLFNILPLPFFDGGKACIVSIEALTGKTVPAHALWFISTFFLAFFLLFIAQVTMNDVKRLIGKK